MKIITERDLATLVKIAKAACAARGPEFYAWRNAPVASTDGRITHTSGWGDSAQTREVTAAEALDICKAKLDGAYGERFMLTVAYVVSAVRSGVRVALLQLQKEPGIPFDATGWVVVSVNGYPMFHVAPEDLPLGEVEKAGMINLVLEGSEDANAHGWKGTNKVEELSLLLDWLLSNGAPPATTTS